MAARELVDPETPLGARTITKDGENMVLVMSDEFNVDTSNYTDKVAWNSSVAEPAVKWTASNTLSYDAFGDSFMHPGMLEARNGSLHVSAAKVKFESADYVGGQLTSWNRVCFQGGYLEVRFKPATNVNGDPLDGYGMDGLWPALWTMGNLLRDNYMIRNRHIWPYSYSDCACPGGFFWGIGRGQEISGCSGRGDYGLNPFQGRGAVEFDLLETTKCKHFDTSISMEIYGVDPSDTSKSTIYGDTCLLQTAQIGPRRPWEYRPFPFNRPTDRTPWYDATGRRDSIWHDGRPSSASPDLEIFSPTFSNIAFYGFGWYDSISATNHIPRDNFLDWHTVGLQVVIDHSCAMYQFPNGARPPLSIMTTPAPSARPLRTALSPCSAQWIVASRRRAVPLNASMAEACRDNSRMSLYYDGNLTQRLFGVGLRGIGVTPAREVPQEPLYILLEHKISPSFGFGTPDETLLPAVLEVDYVRLYQRAGEAPRLSCSPPDHPTADYIRNHRIEYGVQLEGAHGNSTRVSPLPTVCMEPSCRHPPTECVSVPSHLVHRSRGHHSEWSCCRRPHPQRHLHAPRLHRPSRRRRRDESAQLPRPHARPTHAHSRRGRHRLGRHLARWLLGRHRCVRCHRHIAHRLLASLARAGDHCLERFHQRRLRVGDRPCRRFNRRLLYRARFATDHLLGGLCSRGCYCGRRSAHPHPALPHRSPWRCELRQRHHRHLDRADWRLQCIRGDIRMVG